MSRTVRIRLTKEEHGITYVLMVLEFGEQKDGLDFAKPPGSGLSGGRTREGEDVWMAANRELLEETGLRAKIPMDPSIVIPHRDRKGVNTFLFEATEPQGVIAWHDPAIVHVGWYPLQDLVPDDDRSQPVIIHNEKNYPVYRTHLAMIHRVGVAAR